VPASAVALRRLYPAAIVDLDVLSDGLSIYHAMRNGLAEAFPQGSVQRFRGSNMIETSGTNFWESSLPNVMSKPDRASHTVFDARHRFVALRLGLPLGQDVFG
jgi:hypothetical protein